MNFGENKRIEITNTYVVPKNSEKGRHNGGSGGSGRFWSDFITIGSDKKLRMHTDEYLFSAKNLHANDHFMVLTENLPQSEEEHVVVEVNSPKAEELIIIEKSMANTNNECLKYILVVVLRLLLRSQKYIMNCIVICAVLLVIYTGSSGCIPRRKWW